MIIPRIWIVYALFSLLLVGIFLFELWRDLRELENGGRPMPLPEQTGGETRFEVSVIRNWKETHR